MTTATENVLAAVAPTQPDSWLPINVGEKYGAIALDAGTDLKAPVALGGSYFAMPHGTFRLPPHWKEWLGTIKTRAVERAGLLLVAARPSREPDVLDADNEAVLQAVDSLYWGLLASGRVRIDGAGVRLTGAYSTGGIDVRLVADVREVVHMPSLRTTRVAETHLRRAAALADGLSRLFAEPGMRRMKRAVHTFLLAFEERDLGERIHQFVRAVDGITRARNREQFRDRARILVGPGDAEVCHELYVIRSNTEHFHDPSKGLPPLAEREDLVRAHERAHAAEALARFCVSRVVEAPHLWPLLRDEAIDEFWKRPEEERARLWGSPLDLQAELAGFEARLVLDER